MGGDGLQTEGYSLYDGPHTGLEGETAVMCCAAELCLRALVLHPCFMPVQV